MVVGSRCHRAVGAPWTGLVELLALLVGQALDVRAHLGPGLGRGRDKVRNPDGRTLGYRAHWCGEGNRQDTNKGDAQGDRRRGPRTLLGSVGFIVLIAWMRSSMLCCTRISPFGRRAKDGLCSGVEMWRGDAAVGMRRD